LQQAPEWNHIVTHEIRFRPSDLEQLESVGIEPGNAIKQIEQLRNPPAATQLERACTVGDGIAQIQPEDQNRLLGLWHELVESSRVVKFVPASGAATRMFKALRSFLSDRDRKDGVEAAKRFGDNLERFAFAIDLRRLLDAEELAAVQRLEPEYLEILVRKVLSDEGLGFESLPKGLIPFHRYESGPRTAVAEHLFEGLGYLADTNSSAAFHFTVSKDSQDLFQAEIDRTGRNIEATYGKVVEVSYSSQSGSTDTLAIDESKEPFRLPDGRLLLRPSGHGALLENLDRLNADVVYIKNIDNIAPERFHETTALWKRLAAGYFAELRLEAFRLGAELESNPADPDSTDRALSFLRNRFAIQPPPEVVSSTIEERWKFAQDRIDRPLRVAGMVRNEKEPGGGPFWVKSADGSITPQIVEGSQVDLTEPEQKAVWAAATHLNPVDLVCGLTDRHGRRYRLSDYIDFDMAFVTKKSYSGASLMALERPGLWNGSMAGWNTAFVEVPISTFTPVKTIFDLLRSEHLPV
jgi:hypothetical protein